MIFSSRTIWMVLHIALLAVFYAGYTFVSSERQRFFNDGETIAKHKLDYLSAEVKSLLQQKNYQSIDNFIKKWGKVTADVHEVTLNTVNGFELGHYRSDTPAESIDEYQSEINYSYAGDAALVLRISKDRLIAHNTKMNAWLLLGFFIAAAIFYFMVYTMLRLRESGQHLQQENQVRRSAEEALQKREQQLAMTLYSIGDGIIATDEKGVVTRMNPVAEQLTGWLEQEARGQSLLSVFNIINADTREPAANPVNEVLLRGEIVGLANHTVLVSKDGNEYQIADSAAPIKDAEGNNFGAILVFRDVTKEYRTQKMLADNESFQQQMLDGMMTFIAILSVDGEVIFINKSGLSELESDLQQLVGKKLYDIGYWDYSEESRQIIKNDLEASRSAKTHSRDIQAQLLGGSLTWIDFRISKIHDENGELQYLIAEGRNISERKIAEEQLRRGQKMEALGKLTGGIAHDYNNMLGVIMGYAEILSANLQDQPELSKYASEIYRSGERGARLTKKLLSFSRNKPAETEVVDINDVLNEELHMLEKTMTPKIALSLDLQEDVWQLDMDKGDLEDAILNVCINAMHAMPDGGHLILSTRNIQLDGLDAEYMNLVPGDYVEFSITDTGHGMDKETQTRIFDPFYTTKEEGTGLGLSQVYGFVKSAGGAVKVYSELGHGSKIIFWFPRQTNVTGIWTKPKQLDTTNIRGGNETILVVDDEEGLRYLARVVLIIKGYRVFVAKSAEEALHVLEQEHIDLMLSDVIMPGMDGYTLANLIRQRFPRVRIQMVSGFSDDKHLKLVDENLHQNLLTKPYSSAALLNRVRAVLDDGNETAVEPGADISRDAEYGFEADSEWADDMEIGVPAIDSEHKKLHGMLVRCRHLMNKPIDSTVIKTLLDDLLDYANRHFRREEIIMEACGYPHLENHREVHKMLLKQIKKHINNFEQGRFSLEGLLSLLREWFVDHSLGMDRAITEFAKGKDAKINNALKNNHE